MEVSNAVAKALETNFECQGTLGVREPVRVKDDGTIRTLYDSFECRHAAVFAQCVCLYPGSYFELLAIVQSFSWGKLEGEMVSAVLSKCRMTDLHRDFHS